MGGKIVAAPAVLDQVVESATAGAATPGGEDWKRRVRCRSRAWSERRRPEGCCEWYSG